MINAWQPQLFVHLALPRRGAVWCCAIRCHSAPHKRRPKHELASSHQQTITPVSKQGCILKDCTLPLCPLQYVHLGLHHHVPLQRLCWHNSTWWKAGQAPYSKNLLLSSFHFMREQFPGSVVPWKTQLWGASWRAKGPCWAWCLSLEQATKRDV